MNDTETPEPKATTFRLDPDVRALLDTFCNTNRRTMNSAVNYLLANALVEHSPDSDLDLHLRTASGAA